ncbi:MAG: hypothetical protein JSR60_18590 [Proteobacteria bacterium]|nr:hypothetical protein [Pseudomonadota bacterium]
MSFDDDMRAYIASRPKGATTRLFFGTPEEIARQQAAALRDIRANASLPKGIGGGKVAAVVAGVGLALGGAYWLSHRDSPEKKSWVDRVQASQGGLGTPRER